MSLIKPTPDSKNKKYRNSFALWKSAQNYLVPGGTSISKRADLYPLGAYPIYLECADGAYVTDVDGNQYIDFMSGNGAIILGHHHDEISKRIKDEVDKGLLLSLANPSLPSLAKTLCRLIPSAERVRFLKSGSDATAGAVRIARAYTGRSKIIACHYHGWQDWYYGLTNMNRGVPKTVRDDIFHCPYGDMEALKSLIDLHSKEIAAVIMEPINVQMPTEEYFSNLKSLLVSHGILLIFDEVVTGFRFGNGGAQDYFNVLPDLACFGKAIANGLPLSAIVGRTGIMDATQDVVTTLTHGEERLSVEAAIATMEILERAPVVDHIWKLGNYFKANFNRAAQEHGNAIECVGLAPRLELVFHNCENLSRQMIKHYFLQETALEGFLLGGQTIFMSYAHTLNDVELALATCKRILKDIANAQNSLPLTGDSPIELW